MGEASRRKDLVEDVRKKIGEQAAAAVGTLDAQVQQLHVAHKAFVFEIEGLRREVAIAKAAPAELRRDVQSFRGDLAMKAEQLENLGLRFAALEKAYHDQGLVLDAMGEELYTIRYNAGHDFRERQRLLELTWWQRLRWVFTGGLPPLPAMGIDQ